MVFIKYAWLFCGMALLTVAGCKKKDDSPPAPTAEVPKVTTAAVTAISFSTATSGGTITSDGGATVTASGICWSRTNHLPVISDDTTKTIITSGSFTGIMNSLQAGVTYYVRAYAINSVGTAYGNVVNFNTTANVSPLALDVTITGNVKVAETIRARYTYFDLERDPESGTSFQWYVANDTTGGTVTTIANAANINYIVPAASQGKFMRVGITPRASAGASPGLEFKSYWVGPVGAPEPTSVTFTYNGQSVTYGIITSSVSGRKWLDRNLGAPNVPSAYSDWQNEGDLFQWGRAADGHQLINRAASNGATTAVNGSTATLSLSDNPGHALFITPAAAPFDWRSPQNGNLWQTASGINNVCPTGWHVPTKVEWEAESLGVLQDAYTQLKITTGGVRNYNGTFSNTVTAGQYWSSTVFQSTSIFAWSINFSTSSAASSTTSNLTSNGLSVRCIKD